MVGLQYQDDGERFMAELRDRLARFGLLLHSKKTRLIEFGRFAVSNRAKRGADKPASFDFLGFTHLCGRTRKGRFTVYRRSHAGRQRDLLRKIKSWHKRNACIPIGDQGRWLQQVVRGYFQYHAVPGNSDALQTLRREVNRYWLRALRRRSQKHNLPWSRMQSHISRWIPNVRILHPYPSERFAH